MDRKSQQITRLIKSLDRQTTPNTDHRLTAMTKMLKRLKEKKNKNSNESLT